MTRPAVGATVPDFRLPAIGGHTLGLADSRGRNVVLCFHPNDDTPGGTTASRGLRDPAATGIPRDNARSRESSRGNHGPGFDPIAAGDEVACNAFDGLRENNTYARGRPVESSAAGSALMPRASCSRDCAA